MEKTKKEIFEDTIAWLTEKSFTITSTDDTRQWGGFLVINEAQAEKFATHFFPEEDFSSLKITDKLSPKILIVEPRKRLSWQYHHRRAEIWCCVDGPVDVAISDTDHEKHIQTLQNGEIIKLVNGQRHRLIGKDNWGIVAEIWQHTEAENPSDEDDIVRLQDDFGRK